MTYRRKFGTNSPERPGVSLEHILRVDRLTFEGIGGEGAVCERARESESSVATVVVTSSCGYL
jgi:hypothetical protein